MKTKWRVLCVVLAAMVLIAALPGVSMAAVKVAAPKITTVKAISSGSIAVTWKAVKKVKGYEVYRSATAKGTFKKVATLKSAAKVSYTNKSLKASTPYYYKVRAYTVAGGKKVYSKFSAVKGAKTLKKGMTVADPDLVDNTSETGATIALPPGAVPLGSPRYYLNGTKIGDTTIKLDWYSVIGAEGYEIRRATSESGPYSVVGKSDLVIYTDENLTPSTTYYYKVRAYATASGQTYYGPFSPVQTVTTLKKQPKISFSNQPIMSEALYSGMGFFKGSRVKYYVHVQDDAGLTQLTLEESAGKTLRGKTQYQTNTRTISINGPGTYAVEQEITSTSSSYPDIDTFSYTVKGYGASHTMSFRGCINAYNTTWYFFFLH